MQGMGHARHGACGAWEESVSAHPGTAVIVSGHDYRTAARSNMHPIAEALAELGYAVCFLSVGHSAISWLQKDRRCALWRRANRAEQVGNVQCYLWRTAFHPVNPDVPGVALLATPVYRLYSKYPSRFMDDAFRSAAVIIVESGLGVLFLSRARALNPAARIIYLASDDLATLGAHLTLQSELEACAPIIDHVCIVSARMADRFAWAKNKLFVVSHGLNPADLESTSENPYQGGRNAVSVGSMLFDPDFFIRVAPEFPDVLFHAIGSGGTGAFPANVRLYPEMPFRDTVAYIKWATIGLAPYRLAPGCEYLCDTSMKLMQYDFLGLPAVCPLFAVGGNPNRVGYVPGNTESIRRAVAAALERRRRSVPIRYPTWLEATRRLLDPSAPAHPPPGAGSSSSGEEDIGRCEFVSAPARAGLPRLANDDPDHRRGPKQFIAGLDLRQGRDPDGSDEHGAIHMGKD
jgi:2-beta-glucuronyltransferase